MGYGLEPIITDGRAGRLLDEKVLPSYREGDYTTGIVQGTAAIEEYIRSGTPPNPVEDNPLRTLLGDYTMVTVVLGIITIYLMGFMARSRDIWLGSIWGVAVGIITRFNPGQPGGRYTPAIFVGRHRRPAGLHPFP